MNKVLLYLSGFSCGVFATTLVVMADQGFSPEGALNGWAVTFFLAALFLTVAALAANEE